MAIKITSTSRSAIQRPSSKEELRSLIEQELKRQGPDADLNFIDTSLMTDMSYLFLDLKIYNIKIDEWNVSNVTNMEGMFYYCEHFMEHTAFHYAVNCDLSHWDVSNVTNMKEMFICCSRFKHSISNWNVSNVRYKRNAFKMCYALPEHFRPKFK